MSGIKVMIVDDSAVVRQVLSGLLNSAAGITVTHAVANPLLAIERMKTQWPDVIVLDVEMPKMDGITFLRKIMAEHPTPVVICSTLTEKGAQTSVEALSAGAVAIITKPRLDLKQFLHDSADELVSAVRAAAGAHVGKLVNRPPPMPAPKLNADAVLPPADHKPMTATTERVVAIGTSTGGTQALEEVLTSLPRVSPGIVVVQHMPEKFTAAFASRLDSVCEVRVKEAANNDRVLQGQVLIAPGGKHMLLRRTGAQYFRRGGRRPAGQPPPAVGRRAVPLGGARGRRQRAGRDHDRHGRRRRGRHAGDVQGRRAHRGAGRGQLRGVWHAEGSGQARRRGEVGAAERDLP
jgi:two-component system chemotaxis response regulator CheB